MNTGAIDLTGNDNDDDNDNFNSNNDNHVEQVSYIKFYEFDILNDKFRAQGITMEDAVHCEEKGSFWKFPFAHFYFQMYCYLNNKCKYYPYVFPYNTGLYINTIVKENAEDFKISPYLCVDTWNGNDYHILVYLEGRNIDKMHVLLIFFHFIRLKDVNKSKVSVLDNENKNYTKQLSKTFQRLLSITMDEDFFGNDQNWEQIWTHAKVSKQAESTNGCDCGPLQLHNFLQVINNDCAFTDFKYDESLAAQDKRYLPVKWTNIKDNITFPKPVVYRRKSKKFYVEGLESSFMDVKKYLLHEPVKKNPDRMQLHLKFQELNAKNNGQINDELLIQMLDDEHNKWAKHDENYLN